MDYVIAANAPCAALLRPDATVFIDVNPSVTMDRIEKNRMTKELFEETGRLVETRKRYFEAFEKEKDHENVIIINGDREPELVEADIWEKLNPFFS
jgi:dTMP kinase